jgi:hypothetical protein
MVGKVTVRGQGKIMKGKKQTTTTYKSGGRVKKQAGGPMKQGYNARLDESLGARDPGARGSLAGRRAMSKGAERAAGKGAYSGARTMSKKGGKVKAMHGGMKAKKKK